MNDVTPEEEVTIPLPALDPNSRSGRSPMAPGSLLEDLREQRAKEVEAQRQKHLKRKAGSLRKRKEKNVAERKIEKISRRRNRP